HDGGVQPAVPGRRAPGVHGGEHHAGSPGRPEAGGGPGRGKRVHLPGDAGATASAGRIAGPTPRPRRAAVAASWGSVLPRAPFVDRGEGLPQSPGDPAGRTRRPLGGGGRQRGGEDEPAGGGVLPAVAVLSPGRLGSSAGP